MKPNTSHVESFSRQRRCCRRTAPLMGAVTGRVAASARAEPPARSQQPVKVVVWDEQQPAQKEAYRTSWAIRSPIISALNPASRSTRSTSTIPARGWPRRVSTTVMS